ncbi:NUDIX domain-containing protein [Paenibacillus prosopidis]|uniref:NUDIX domain-containing protein n=1 Tax=Paenibacillus prosopidis TaxID=630520 RepID=UPI00319E91E1
MHNKDFTRFLVQCDVEETFYRFPGGGVEFGETASETIVRELFEEFDLELNIGQLALINESIIEYDGIQRHDCTLIHWCWLNHDSVLIDMKMHKEHDDIKLVWKSLEQLTEKPLYPEGILEMMMRKTVSQVHHSVIRKTY